MLFTAGKQTNNIEGGPIQKLATLKQFEDHKKNQQNLPLKLSKNQQKSYYKVTS